MTNRTLRGALALTVALLWALPMGALAWSLGWNHTFTQMGWFFTKAALLTFGGAYAVLPYVYQGAVVEHGWLLGPQMIDGLALGETTPGPLIMVVAFVGFVGGWQTQVLGPDALFLGAALAAVGRGLLVAAPWLQPVLAVAGTAALFLVGGGILFTFQVAHCC